MAPVTIVKSETDTSLDQAYLAFGTFVGTTNVTAAGLGVVADTFQATSGR